MRQKYKTLQLQKNKKFKNFHDQKRKKNDKNKKTNNHHRVNVVTIKKNSIKSNFKKSNYSKFSSFIYDKKNHIFSNCFEKYKKKFVNTIKNNKK